MSIKIVFTKKEAISLIKMIMETDMAIIKKDMNTLMLCIKPISNLVQRLDNIKTAKSSVKIDISTAAALFMIFNAYDVEEYSHLLDVSIKVSEFVSIEGYKMNKRMTILPEEGV